MKGYHYIIVHGKTLESKIDITTRVGLGTAQERWLTTSAGDYSVDFNDFK